MEPTQTLSNEDKMIGMFSHFSIFLGGFIVPLVFWLIYREKSQFIRFHSLQAIFFHVAYLVVMFVWIFIIIFGAIGVGLSTAAWHNHGGSGLIGLFFILFYGLLFLIAFGCFGYAVYMGIESYHGKYVKYPLIGNVVFNHVFGE